MSKADREQLIDHYKQTLRKNLDRINSRQNERASGQSHSLITQAYGNAMRKDPMPTQNQSLLSVTDYSNLESDLANSRTI